MMAARYYAMYCILELYTFDLSQSNLSKYWFFHPFSIYGSGCAYL